MYLLTFLFIFGGLKIASASQLSTRPADVPVCDFYANALFGSNNPATQLHLIEHLFNQAVVGNFAPTNKSVIVSGFANSQPYHGSYQTLSHYFDGSLNSTNTGGEVGGQKIFLDDGGPVPLLSDKASNETASNQYKLFTHVYYLWGELLNCSMQGGADFPFYNGNPNMWEVHKYMDIGPKQNGLLIDQNIYSALALGFSKADADAFNYTLNTKYNYRCSPPSAVADSKSQNSTSYPQSICIAADCPIDPNGGNCAVEPYNEKVLVPTNVTTDASSNSSGTVSGSASSTTSQASSTFSASSAATGATGEHGLLFTGAAIAGAVLLAYA